MKVAGSAVLNADRERVWSALHDPAVLARVIPGCQGLVPLGDNHFGMTVTLGVASIKGSYSGEVRLRDVESPASLVMHAVGAGGPGTVDTTVQVDLISGEDGTTTLSYDADAVVGGMVGGVGQRVLVSVARKTAGLFFAAVDDVLTGAAGTEPVAPSQPRSPAQAPLPAVPALPAVPPLPAAPSPTGAGGWPALAGAAVFGAVTALAGVLVGSRLGRRAL